MILQNIIKCNISHARPVKRELKLLNKTKNGAAQKKVLFSSLIET